MSYLLVSGVLVAAFVVVAGLLGVMFRRVVTTNEVAVVQSRRQTIAYGKGQAAGNVYYKWPSWIPRFGVMVIKLPVSNFALSLKDYEAYDRDRVPFKVDVTAFFRISEPGTAAQRVATIQEMHNQLTLIVQGAVRKVLASDLVDTIMLERSKFGDLFTQEVAEQLAEWGINSVKTMELMDIRDGHDSQVISNIMAKKTSHIEMESRREVAQNMKLAELAEIEAKQIVSVRQQESEQAIGERTAEKDKLVGIADQQARQEVLTQERETKTRSMAVQQVDQVRRAEIEREQQVVAADQDRQTRILKAEGQLEAQRKEARGIQAIGEAKAAAEKAMQMAPVTAKIQLAKEIGSNAGYQNYLTLIEGIAAYLAVGSKQAEALKEADVKVIANAGSPTEGMKSVMDLFTSRGGTNLAAAIEALAQSPLGKEMLGKLGVRLDAPSTVVSDEPADPATLAEATAQ